MAMRRAWPILKSDNPDKATGDLLTEEVASRTRDHLRWKPNAQRALPILLAQSFQEAPQAEIPARSALLLLPQPTLSGLTGLHR